MITILNPKVSQDGTATAELKIYSACCKTTIPVIAHYKNGVFSDAINADSGVSIYVRVQEDLVKSWLEYMNKYVTT